MRSNERIEVALADDELDEGLTEVHLRPHNPIARSCCPRKRQGPSNTPVVLSCKQTKMQLLL